MALSILMFNGSFRVNPATVFIDVDVTVSVLRFNQHHENSLLRKQRY